MPITRRSLLNGMAKLGGIGAVYETLVVWDLLRPAPAMAASFSLPANSGRGKRVAILGAGISGICAAYELDRAGYDCIVLEPAQQAGGRSLTLRRGDSFREIGQPRQVCEFDRGLWLNAGPGRIPHHHVHSIDYCRRFGVALQPYIFASRANLLHSSTLGNGRTVQVREAFYSLQGHVAELLDKCSRQEVELPVSKDDLGKLQEMLVQFGDLSRIDVPGKAPSWSYKNQSGRAGFELPAGVATPIKPLTPMRLEEILRSNVWNDWLLRDADIYWQSSLMEPVGGMDNFFKGFLRQPRTRGSGTIESLIRYGTKATGIDVRSNGVGIRYEQAGGARTLEADHCICTIPVPILAKMKSNLPATFIRTAADLPLVAAGKVGWQAPRFWETESQIYGGISWTSDLIDQIWYPSHDYLSAKGVLTGAYMRHGRATEFNAKPLAERLRLAREQGEKLHPNFGKHVEHGLAIAWEKMEHLQMAWANEEHADFEANSKILAEPQGRFHLAGDQITFLSGWQEGAIVAAWHAVKNIDRQVRQ